MIDLDQPGTQSQFGILVGVSQQAVSQFLARGVLADGASLGQWLLTYTAHLRDQAAGRGGDQQQNLAEAKTAEAKASTELKLLTIEEKAGRLVPADAVEFTLRGMVTAARAELMTMAEKLRIETQALYGIEIDPDLIHAHIEQALDHLARPGNSESEPGAGAGDDGMGAAA